MWSELPNLIQEIREVKEVGLPGGQIAQSPTSDQGANTR